MNRLLLPLALFASATLTTSCGDHKHDAAAHDTHAVDAHTHATEGSAPTTSESALPSVTLDNGQRWKANPETTSGIANMTNILNAYDPASGDPKALKAALEEEFGLIFERCTMTGEAHEQLHNYLVPIHSQLSGFTATEDQRKVMSDHLAVYANYFE